MRLAQSIHGISKLMFVISLLVALIMGATLSYAWTMGYYASKEYQLPEKPSLSIETADFSAKETALFNVVILNPSYSPSSADITRITVLTANDALHDVEVSPNLPFSLKVGRSETFSGVWNWSGYAGQTVKIIVFVSDGSGPTAQIALPTLD